MSLFRRFRISIVGLVLGLALVLPVALSRGASLHTGATDIVRAQFAQASSQTATIEAWISPESDSELAMPVYWGSGSDGYGLLMHNAVDGTMGRYSSIALQSVSFSATGSSARLPKNVWTHLALTRSLDRWTLYKNGALVGSGSAAAIPPTLYLWIGKHFAGYLSEVRLWDHARTQADIRSTMMTRLRGDEAGLTVYYPLNDSSNGSSTVLRNRASSTLGQFDILIDVTASTTLSLSVESPSFQTLPSPVSKFSVPQHMQFFAREQDDSASVHFAGTGAFDSVILTMTRNDTLVNRRGLAVQNGSFAITGRIHAEPSQYTFRLYGSVSGSLFFLAESADLVCGDVYLICGQSNAHPANASVTVIDPLLRTFGVQTDSMNYAPYDPSDTSWGLANAHGFGHLFSGPYLTGVWGLRLQQLILQTYHIPVCIINGAAGASRIEENLRIDAHPMDLTSIYGRTLYRAEQSGLRSKIKAIFWYQGEFNFLPNYYKNFTTLSTSWSRDYTTLKRIYLFQIRPGCFVQAAQSDLRDLQRTIPDSMPIVRVMSTAGVPGQDGCHYSPAGYFQTAMNIFRLVAEEFYGSKDTLDIDPPNIQSAFYTSKAHDEIAVLFRKNMQVFLPNDTLVGGRVRSMKEYMYLDDKLGGVSGMTTHGDTLLLRVALGTSATLLNYLPDVVYPDSSYYYYEGPWLLNKRGIGVLTFWHFPITETPQRKVGLTPPDQTPSLTIFPNPSIGQITFSVRGIASLDATVRVYDLLGKETYSETLPIESDKMQLHFSFPPGSYILELRSDRENVSAQFAVE